MKGEAKSKISIGLLLLVALAWGTSYAILKETLDIIPPFTLTTVRFGVSALILTILYGKKLKEINKEALLHGMTIGIFLFFSFLGLVKGIQFTSAAKQSFLVGSYVVMVPFLAWLINRKKPDIYSVIGVICAGIGLGLLTLVGVEGINIGDFISIFAAVAIALHMIMVEKYCRKSDPIMLTIIQLWVTAFLFLILTGVVEGYDFSIVMEAKMGMAYLILAPTIFAFVVQNVAQKYVSSTTTALVLSLEAVFGSVFAFLYLGERLGPTAIVGCVIVMIGIITQETKWEFLKRKK